MRIRTFQHRLSLMPAVFPPQSYDTPAYSEYLSFRSTSAVTWALSPPPTPHQRKRAARRAMGQVQDFGSKTNPRWHDKSESLSIFTKLKMKARANHFNILICIPLPHPPFFCRGKAQTVNQYTGLKNREVFGISRSFQLGKSTLLKSSLKTKLQFIYKRVWTQRAPQLFWLRQNSASVHVSLCQHLNPTSIGTVKHTQPIPVCDLFQVC